MYNLFFNLFTLILTSTKYLLECCLVFYIFVPGCHKFQRVGHNCHPATFCLRWRKAVSPGVTVEQLGPFCPCHDGAALPAMPPISNNLAPPCSIIANHVMPCPLTLSAQFSCPSMLMQPNRANNCPVLPGWHQSSSNNNMAVIPGSSFNQPIIV